MNKINSLYFKIRNKFAYKTPVVYNFCEKRKLFLKYSLIGTINGTLGLLLLYLFHDVLNLNIVPSTSFSFLICFSISFIFQKYWAFRNKKKHSLSQLPFFGVNAFIGFLLNGFFMHLLVNVLSWWYLLSQIFINISIGIYNFFVFKYLIFKKNK